MFSELVPEYIAAIKPYPPGKPLTELARELGITAAVKLASNENPLGPSPKALAAIRQNLAELHRYPDPGAYNLRQALAHKLGLAPEQLLCGNGSDEILELLVRVFLRPGDEVIYAAPGFLMYPILAQAAGAVVRPVPLQEYRTDLAGILRAVTPRTKLIFLNNPHNPTGTVFYRQEWEDFLAFLPERVVVVVDEAYFEFVTDPRVPTALAYLQEDRPLLGLRTFSKAYGLAGIRLGYAYGPAALLSYLDRIRSPFNVNSLAQAAGVAALEDEEFLARTRQIVQEGLAYLGAAFSELGLEYLPSQANFLLVNLRRPAAPVYEALLRRGVIVRPMTSYDFPEYIRVNAGLPEENRRLIASLKEVLSLGS